MKITLRRTRYKRWVVTVDGMPKGFKTFREALEHTKKLRKEGMKDED